MDPKIDDLLAFCAYYTLAKTAIRLPLTNLPHPPSNKPDTKTKPEKILRKKFEVAEPKRQERALKHKIQQVPKNSVKRSVSPIERIDMRQPKQEKSKKYDLDYFVSHMAGAPTHSKTYEIPYKNRQYQPYSTYSKNYQQPTHNYQTFGKSGMYNQLETFEEKVRREGNKYSKISKGNFTDRQQKKYNFPKYPQNQNPRSKYYVATEAPSIDQTLKKTQRFVNQQIMKTNYFGPPFYEQPFSNQLYDQHTMSYSPSAKSYTPSKSSVWIKNSPDNTLSKSRSKHQRKNSQRPMFDASKLTLKSDNQQNNSKSFDQNMLSQSFVSAAQDNTSIKRADFTNDSKRYEQVQARRIEVTDPKRSQGYDHKRDTSTTAPPRINKNGMHQYVKNGRQSDLDDCLGEALTQLQQRQAPIAFQVRVKSKY